MERDLQKALRRNIAQLQPDLRIVDGGKERQTDAGNIDITAEDSTGTTVIIELKAGEAQPEALTQLLAYMGAIDNSRPVRGILIAGDFHQRLTYAAKAIPNVTLHRYGHRFTFDCLTETRDA
jgi:RecB family endonuclease NucS